MSAIRPEYLEQLEEEAGVTARNGCTTMRIGQADLLELIRGYRQRLEWVAPSHGGPRPNDGERVLLIYPAGPAVSPRWVESKYYQRGDRFFCRWGKKKWIDAAEATAFARVRLPEKP